ncbi:MAG: fatty acid desaturase family protein [Rhizobiaceae bacterium]|nr:fatty acid desaturase family protein [Rhizobiaceae bacterium]
MTTAKIKPDYSLTGEAAQRAVDEGLDKIRWYRTDVDKKALKSLMERKDGTAIRDTAIWFLMLGISGLVTMQLWGTIWCVPFFFVYEVLYGSAGDSRWHECGHGTAFKTQWMNRVIYHIACFMMIRNPVVWRWSHTRHHADTIVVGRDPEIALMRPADLMRIAFNFFGIIDTINGIKDMFRIGVKGLNEAEQTYVPDGQAKSAILAARIWIGIYCATLIGAVEMGSVLPFMLIGLPRLYGAWHHVLTGLLQHGGLAENVTDHRANTRTVMMNPISRFVYWNMNYHIEHHMFLMVPYHALPQLHERIKHDLPKPNASILDGYREMWPVLKKQLQNVNFYLIPELPEQAKPYSCKFPQI